MLKRMFAKCFTLTFQAAGIVVDLIKSKKMAGRALLLAGPPGISFINSPNINTFATIHTFTIVHPLFLYMR